MMYNRRNCHDQTNRCSGTQQANQSNSFERTAAMYFGNEQLIDSIVDKYTQVIGDGSAKLVDGEEANLADSTLSYVRNFLNESGIKYQQVTPEVDGVCCLRMVNDPLLGYLLHFVDEGFHIWMDKDLKQSLHPKCAFWYLLTLKVQGGILPIPAIYHSFGIKTKRSPDQRNIYEARKMAGGILAKGDHSFCQSAISKSGLLGVNHYLIPADVRHEDFAEKVLKSK